METHARYFLIGLFSLAVTLMLILFVLWLGKLQIDREFQDYDVLFHESVTGLSVGGIVQYHGIQVGEVRKLSLDPEDPREVRARIRVAAETPIKTDTKAQLSYTGLTGVAVIEMFGGTPQAKLLREDADDGVPVIDTVPSTLSQLVSGGSGAMSNAQEVLARIAEVLSDQNIQRVSATLDNLAEVSAEVKKDYPALREALADARGLEQRLNTAAKRADELLASVQKGMAASADGKHPDLFVETRAAINEIRGAADELRRFANSGEQLASGIDQQARTELAATLGSLREISENLVRISARFDQAPADYLLGGKSLPDYQPKQESK